jgi:hypothetical protein
MKIGKLPETGKALALAVLLGATATLPGCAPMLKVMGADLDPMGGQVVRVVVNFGWHGNVESSAVARFMSSKEAVFIARGGVLPPADQIAQYRWVRVVGPGWKWKAGKGPQAPTGPANVLVADSVPLLHDGDWVDVYVPKDIVMGKNRWLTVVRLVCKYDDDACKAREQASVGKPEGQAVANEFDEASISITPHYDASGNWLPGKQPARP